ncbi:MAG: hypothetical protein IJC17_01760 [Clostridia bacterium]|nr:hypothetical protein [Clostridia bacterium]
MPRKFALAGVKEEELRPNPKPEEPQTPKSKWENFWYYNKWFVLGGALALIVAIYFVVDIATRVNADYEGMLVTAEAYNAQATEALKEELMTYADDINHDGKLKMGVNVLAIGDGTQTVTETTSAYIMKMQILLSDGRTKLVIFDQSWYDRIGQEILKGKTELFAPLDVDDAGYNAEEHYWDWYGSDLQKSEWAKSLPEHLYFGVRPAYDTEDAREVRDAAAAKTYLENLIGKTPPKTTAKPVE